jgi:hypothetical protein
MFEPDICDFVFYAHAEYAIIKHTIRLRLRLLSAR